MPPPETNANIARHLALMAAAAPGQPALKIPRGRTADGRIDYLTLTFTEPLFGAHVAIGVVNGLPLTE